MAPIVRLEGITQRFGTLTALDRVDFEVQPGTIHALVGENGAGKTTLMRVLYGAIQPDEGRIEVDGTERRWSDSADAIEHGIGMVSQHYSVIPELTCLQNLVLGAEGAFVLPLPEMKVRADSIAQRLGFTFEWDALASSLSPAAAQKLEISKLLWRASKVMVLDEPTAMLSPADADALYESLRQLASEGATVIVVTHRIAEVVQHCERVTVLRGGRKVAELDVAATTSHALAELIVGHALPKTERSEAKPGATVLDVNGLTVRGARKDDAVKGAKLTVRSGEVVGLAGVDGNGQRELVQAIIGTAAVAEGSIALAGSDVTRTPVRDRIRLGLRLIPEDRHEEGIVEDWSLVDNAVLGLQRVPPNCRGPWSNLAERASLAQRVADRFNTKHEGLYRPMRDLSGGNQQRFVAARAMEQGPRLILAFQPARGLDIDATAKVYAHIRSLCQAGAAALIVSFDLDELLEECDRVLVVHGGRVLVPETSERNEIGRLMVGAS